jgi:exodeoxyribonuclease-3
MRSAQISSDDDAFTYWPEERGEDGWRVDLQIVSEDLQRHRQSTRPSTPASSFSRHAPLIVDYDLE